MQRFGGSDVDNSITGTSRVPVQRMIVSLQDPFLESSWENVVAISGRVRRLQLNGPKPRFPIADSTNFGFEKDHAVTNRVNFSVFDTGEQTKHAFDLEDLAFHFR